MTLIGIALCGLLFVLVFGVKAARILVGAVVCCAAILLVVMIVQSHTAPAPDTEFSRRVFAPPAPAAAQPSSLPLCQPYQGLSAQEMSLYTSCRLPH